MDVLGDAVRRERRSDSPALRAPAVGRAYDYRRFCTSAWKVGNFLRHLGVRRGAGVGVGDDPRPEPVLAFYGAALLGGVVRFDPAADVGGSVRTLVVPAAHLEDYEADPATKRLAYGADPGDPSVAYFEREVWSENPTEPPDPVAPDDLLLWTPSATYTHGDVLDAARSAAETLSIDAETVVAVRGPFADPSVVVAGLVAPIAVGGVVSLGGDGDVVVGGSCREDSGISSFDAGR